MKINGINNNNVINIYSRLNKNNSVKRIKKVQDDSIQISSVGKSLSAYSIEEKFQASPKRLEEIRQKINNGTYNIDSKEIAKKMMELMKGKNE